MKKIIVISDSFKGTLSSSDICSIAEEVIPSVFPDCDTVSLPVADGGEGTVECVLKSTASEPVSVRVNGAFMGEDCTAVYARMGKRAVIEMASAAGLPSVEGRKDPSATTTYGVGQLIRHAIENGCTELFLGLGGSATNDGGCGCAAAMGTVFTDENGKSFIPTGGTLGKIRGIDASETKKLLKGVSVTVMSDVQNPLYGPRGAAYVFAPQKGADEETVRMLDAGLRNMAEAVKKELGCDIADVPGAGAAGGMGGGMLAFFGAQIVSGIEALLRMNDFDARAESADLVITGEGKLDSQSVDGKVISGIAQHTKRLGKPLIAIVGCIDDGADKIYDMGVSAVFSTNRRSLPFEELKARARDDYRRTLRDVLSAVSIGIH